MSDAKVPGKTSAESKKTKPEKTKVEKTDTKKTENVADKTSADKTDATPKSASESSISHFSSVSTPEYKEGWDSIFGGSKNAVKKDDSAHFPERLSIHNDDIDEELGGALYKAFQRQARKQGISLAKIKKQVDFEYSLDCNLKKKSASS